MKLKIRSANSWCARYVSDDMLDDFDKGFRSFANQMSSNVAKVSLFVIPLKIGCTPPICYNSKSAILVNIFTNLLFMRNKAVLHVVGA